MSYIYFSKTMSFFSDTDDHLRQADIQMTFGWLSNCLLDRHSDKRSNVESCRHMIQMGAMNADVWIGFLQAYERPHFILFFTPFHFSTSLTEFCQSKSQFHLKISLKFSLIPSLICTQSSSY